MVVNGGRTRLAMFQRYLKYIRGGSLFFEFSCLEHTDHTAWVETE